MRDCRGDGKTRCTLTPGKTAQAGSAWFGDLDAYAQVLGTGERYSFTAKPAPDSYCYLQMRLLDGKRKRVAQAPAVGDETAAIKDLRPATPGKHYLRLICDSDDSGGQYSVGMNVR